MPTHKCQVKWLRSLKEELLPGNFGIEQFNLILQTSSTTWGQNFQAINSNIITILFKGMLYFWVQLKWFIHVWCGKCGWIWDAELQHLVTCWPFIGLHRKIKLSCLLIGDLHHVIRDWAPPHRAGEERSNNWPAKGWAWDNLQKLYFASSNIHKFQKFFL